MLAPLRPESGTPGICPLYVFRERSLPGTREGGGETLQRSRVEVGGTSLVWASFSPDWKGRGGGGSHPRCSAAYKGGWGRALSEPLSLPHTPLAPLGSCPYYPTPTWSAKPHRSGPCSPPFHYRQGCLRTLAPTVPASWEVLAATSPTLLAGQAAPPQSGAAPLPIHPPTYCVRS